MHLAKIVEDQRTRMIWIIILGLRAQRVKLDSYYLGTAICMFVCHQAISPELCQLDRRADAVKNFMEDYFIF